MKQNRSGTVSFKELLEKMYPEADFMDIKVLMHMANPKALAPKAKPDLKVSKSRMCCGLMGGRSDLARAGPAVSQLLAGMGICML